MHPLRLREKVTIRHPSFSGMSGGITFRPIDDTRWWLRTKNGGRVEIAPDLMTHFGQQLTVKASDGTKCDIYEHIGVLRFFGLVGVEIEILGRPPYYGRSIELWQALELHCETDTGTVLPLYTVERTMRWEYPKLRGGGKAFVELSPATKPYLTVAAFGDFPGIGSERRDFRFPDRQALAEVCTGYPAGLPRYRYAVGRALRYLTGWPHLDSVAWPQRMKSTDFVRSVVNHRVLDALGAFSLLCADGMLVGHLVQQRAGHEADVEVIRRAAGNMRRL